MSSPYAGRIAVGVLALLLAVAPGARAVDLTGVWRISYGAPSVGGAASPEVLAITQQGTTLTATVPGFRNVIFTGAVDPASGIFRLDLAYWAQGAWPLGGPPVFCTATFSGSASAGTLGGTQRSRQQCIPPPFSCQGQCLTPVERSFTAVRTTCLDGVLDPGEACDTGRYWIDCCTNTCDLAAPVGAQCEAISSESGTCSAELDCLVPCGNGAIDSGEQCDEGASGCCGNRCERLAAGTLCPEDGNPATTDTCDAAGACQHLPSSCGNGAADPGEECDDGDLDGADCCFPNCRRGLDGSPCADDGNPATTDRCKAGVCTHVQPGCG